MRSTAAVYDALTATRGEMYGVENDEVYAAHGRFSEDARESISSPRPAWRLPCSSRRCRSGAIEKQETVLLNITGGGEARLRKEKKTYSVVPQYLSKNITEKQIEELLCNVLKKN